MKNGPCPRCANHEIYLIEDVTDQVGATSIGLAQDAYVCSACGLIEFYARDLAALAALGRVHRAGGGGPFR